MLNDQEVKASAAPRITPDRIEAAIKDEQYHVFEGTTVTVCMLTLSNGAKVIGHNYGSIDPAQQDWTIGKIEAREMAVEKVWELEGYALRCQLESQKGWGCADCLAVFPEGIPKTCPHNAIGCAELLAQGK